MLPRKEARLIVAELDRGPFELLGSQEPRKRIDFFLLPYIRTVVLSLLLDSWFPYGKAVGKLNFDHPLKTARSLFYLGSSRSML